MNAFANIVAATNFSLLASEDGNKRTAVAYLSALLEEYKIPYDRYKIDKLVLAIAKDTKSIDKIRRMIKNAIR